MKQPKIPTRAQRKAIAKSGRDTYEWKVVREFADSLEIINMSDYLQNTTRQTVIIDK